jgi:DNA-binding winged helix-turn-helix (wHTH) protein
LTNLGFDIGKLLVEFLIVGLFTVQISFQSRQFAGNIIQFVGPNGFYESKKTDKKILEEIMKLTGGHANLVRHCLEAILAANDKSVKITPEFFLNQKPIRSTLFGIWDNLNPSEQNALTLLNLEGQDVSYLEKIGLIEKSHLTIPLLRDYAKQSLRIKSENEGNFLFDQNTNEIKKGGLVISDKLTSFEFKLLKFFILNKDRIIERNEAINAVWGNQHSTAGVTEQALDQLVFRLRKKIEDDPNSPLYLQTVKGRGFKFSN